MVRLESGSWVCNQCGKVIEGVPPDKTPRVTVVQASGQPIMRTLTLDGKEVHRCEVRPARP